MGIKSWITGIKPQEAFDTIAKGADKLFFTQEERADFNLNIADKFAEFAGQHMGESTVRSKTRRYMAIAIVTNTILLSWVCVILAIKGKDIDVILEIVAIFQLGWAFITVIGFHFGTYLLKTVSPTRVKQVKAAIKKEDKKTEE